MDFSENIYFPIGFCVGFIIVAIVINLIKSMKKKKNNGVVSTEYDERQKAIRGVAYQYAFFSLLAYFLGNGFVCMFTDNWASTLEMNFIGVCISLIVFTGYAICKDAYVSFQSKLSYYTVIFFIVGLINIAIFIMNVITDGLSDSQYPFINLECGVTFVVITIIAVAKIMYEKQVSKKEFE